MTGERSPGRRGSRDKLWLIGGGLARPWSYGELWDRVGRGDAEANGSVGGILIALTRALVRGDYIELHEPLFSCEGQAEQKSEVGDQKSEVAEAAWADVLHRGARIALYSSGTNGTPTCVVHTLESLARAVVVNERHRDDVWGLAFNPSHIAGVQVYLQALANANTIVNLWGIEPAEVVERCAAWGVTHLSATPTFYRLLLSLEPVLPAVRSVSVGGESADPRLIARLRTAFPNARLHNIYASTEAGTLLMSDGVEFTLSGDASDLRPPTSDFRPPTSDLRHPTSDLSAGGGTSLVQIIDGRLWVHRSLLGEAVVIGETVVGEAVVGAAVRQSGGEAVMGLDADTAPPHGFTALPSTTVSGWRNRGGWDSGARLSGCRARRR
jgi:acyl-CoA synthetase (AMP-forming)/AMP-acid ligase II